MAGKSTVGALNIMVGANIRRLNQNLSAAAKRFQRFGASVLRIGRTIARYSAVAITAATAIGVVMVKRQAAAIDSLAKVSDRLGIATERLAGLHHAASIASISSDTMNMALQRMIRRVAEAGQGTGEAVKAIAELGLNAQALAKMTPEQQLATFADALMRVENQSDRVRLAFKLFDSEGVRMLNMLQHGSAGLRAMQADAERLGLTISRTDAAKVEEANDAFTRMSGAIGGASRQLTVALAPAITRVFNIAAFAIQNWRDVWGLVSNQIVFEAVRFGNRIHYVFTEVIPSVVLWLANNWKKIITDMLNWALTTFTNFGKNIVAILSNIPDLVAGTVDFADLWTPLSEGFEATLNSLPKIAERQIGGIEGALADEVDRIARRLGKKWADTFAAPLLKMPDLQLPEVTAADAGDAPDEEKAAETRRDESLRLIRAGTAEALADAQRVNRRMQNENNQKQQLAAQQSIAMTNKQIVDHMKNLHRIVTVSFA